MVTMPGQQRVETGGELSGLAPERCAPDLQTWNSYPAVEVPSADAVLTALASCERWPDYATAVGRFAPLCTGGLIGQVFEIEMATGTGPGAPVAARAHVTVTKLLTPSDPGALRAWFAELEDSLARYADEPSHAAPYGARPIAGIELSAHVGHFMGAGRNRILLYTHGGRAWIRAAGSWDPQKVADRELLAAHHALWGRGSVAGQSMLHQIALKLG